MGTALRQVESQEIVTVSGETYLYNSVPRLPFPKCHELLLYGLDPESASRILNTVIERVRRHTIALNEPFCIDRIYGQFILRPLSLMQSVHRRGNDPYCHERYCVQVVWTFNEQPIFPGEEGALKEDSQFQLLLFLK